MHAREPVPGPGGALAKLEPDNGAAWIPAVGYGYYDHDQVRTDEALAHMASAKAYDDKSRDLVEAWDEIVRRYPPPKLPSTIPGVEQSKPGTSDPGFVKFLASQHGLFDNFSPFYMEQSCTREALCRADPRRGTYCAKAARLLLDQGPSIIVKSRGMDMLESSAFVTAEDRARIRALRWQMEQFGQVVRDDPATALRLWGNGRSGGEWAGVLEHLARTRVPLTPAAGWNPPVKTKPAFDGCGK